MIALRADEAGTLLPVKARPKSRRNAIVGEHDGALKVAVTAAPEKGKANGALTALLADAFGLAPSAVQLLRGETSGDKTFLLVGLDEADARDRLAVLLADT